MMDDYKTTQKQNIKELVDILQDSLNYKTDNNPERLSQMLTNQAIALDSTFQRLLADSDSEYIWKNETKYNFSESNFFTALKAQSQCQQTVIALQNVLKEEKKSENPANELKHTDK